VALQGSTELLGDLQLGAGRRKPFAAAAQIAELSPRTRIDEHDELSTAPGTDGRFQAKTCLQCR